MDALLDAFFKIGLWLSGGTVDLPATWFWESLGNLLFIGLAIWTLFIFISHGPDARLFQSVMVRYRPPALPNRKRMSPAVFGSIFTSRSSIREITATIVDLGQRGYLQLVQEKKFNGQSQGWVLIRKKWDDAGLQRFEKTILFSLFQGKPRLQLDDLRGQLWPNLPNIHEDIHQELVDTGCFRHNPELFRYRTLVRGGFGVFVVFLGLMAFYYKTGLPNHSSWLFLGGSWLLVLLVVAFLPPRTVKGMIALREAQGLREFLMRAKKDQLQHLEKRGKDLYEPLLPYALAVGMAKTWSKRFEHLQTPVPKDQEFSGEVDWTSMAAWTVIDLSLSCVGSPMYAV